MKTLASKVVGGITILAVSSEDAGALRPIANGVFRDQSDGRCYRRLNDIPSEDGKTTYATLAPVQVAVFRCFRCSVNPLEIRDFTMRWSDEHIARKLAEYRGLCDGCKAAWAAEHEEPRSAARVAQDDSLQALRRAAASGSLTTEEIGKAVALLLAR